MSFLIKTLDKVAIFYILNTDDDIILSVCKIVKKYYEEDNKILISSQNSVMIKSINNLLWTFEQLSFIPHATNEQYDPLASVLLFDTNYKNDSILKNDYNIFINLDDEVKTDYHNHEVIVELVSNNEEQKKIARERYLYYKKNKLDARHENL